MKNGHHKATDRVRYAVVGLGHIAQAAVLPAFKHAKENSVLTALVSDDPVKRQELGKKYGVTRTYSYDQFEQCVNSDEVDAVYIALPNHLHCEFALRTFDAGRHVLCEKPMAKKVFSKRDQFAAELMHFSDCVLNGRSPEPGGLEGLADVRVIEALYRSAAENRPVVIEPVSGLTRPSLAQQIHKPPVKKPELVHTASPHANDPDGQ